MKFKKWVKNLFKTFSLHSTHSEQNYIESFYRLSNTTKNISCWKACVLEIRGYKELNFSFESSLV